MLTNLVIIKDPVESKYQLLLTEDRLNIKNNPKAFSDYPQTIDDVYENLKDYNPTNKKMQIADMEANKKLQPIAAELFMRGRKLNISLAFDTPTSFQSA